MFSTSMIDDSRIWRKRSPFRSSPAGLTYGLGHSNWVKWHFSNQPEIVRNVVSDDVCDGINGTRSLFSGVATSWSVSVFVSRDIRSITTPTMYLETFQDEMLRLGLLNHTYNLCQAVSCDL
jgi:hypothetical protein